MGFRSASSDSSLELMGGVSKISDQFSFIVSIIALGGAVFLIVKAMLSNLVERSREIGILKAVGWTERDVQKQLMGEVFLQSLLGGVLGILMGYFFSYLLGFLSIPVSTSWELNLLPAFAKDTAAAAQTVRLPVSISAGLTAVSLALSLVAGGYGELCHGETNKQNEASRDTKATIGCVNPIGWPFCLRMFKLYIEPSISCVAKERRYNF